MAAMLYRCPTTGQTVQGWFADDEPTNGRDTYEGTICIACGGMHLVNPKTGKTLGSLED